MFELRLFTLLRKFAENELFILGNLLGFDSDFERGVQNLNRNINNDIKTIWNTIKHQELKNTIKHQELNNRRRTQSKNIIYMISSIKIKTQVIDVQVFI